MHCLSRLIIAGVMLLGTCLGLVAAPAQAAPTYTITDLGLLREGDEGSRAFGINQARQVVGTSGVVSIERAFLWQNGAMSDLGALPGSQTSEAFDINDRGQIVGHARLDAVDPRIFHAVLWQNGNITALPELGDEFSSAVAINNSGVAVGVGGNFGTGFERALIWRDGVVDQLQERSEPTTSFASDINDRGQVVGASRSLIDGRQYAVVWQGDTIVDLGDLPGGRHSAAAQAINDHGRVVGTSEAEDGLRAFLWVDGMMIDLGVLPGSDDSHALDINNRGQIVGYNSRDDIGVTSPFLWDDGEMLDLASLVTNLDGWRLWQPNAINDAGQIVGVGITRGPINPWEIHAFLLTPVPEPSALLLFGLIAFGLAVRRHHGRPRLARSSSSGLS